MQFIDNPGLTPEQALQDPMRRLCIFHYHCCPLCGRNHDFDIYITREARDLDEFHAGLQKLVQDPGFRSSALDRAAVKLHTERGDMEKQARRYRKHGLRKTRPPWAELTDEQEYTCDDCSRTFDTMKDLRNHMESCR